VTLKLSRGLVIRGVVSDKEGKPVAGATVVAHNNGQSFRSDMTKTDAEGKYELAALSPRVETYIVAFADAGNASTKLGGLPKHPLDEARQEEINFNLQPGVVLSGQAYHNVRPRAGVKLRLIKIVSENMGRSLRLGETVTDAEGKYRLAGLVAGDQYQIEIADPDGLVAAGWRHQSPYISFAPEGKEAALPPMHLSALTQRLAGVVVDRKGKPLAGISVSAQMPDRSSIPRTLDGPPPFTVTDDAGEFELQQLPEGQILLLAYKANPGGGVIRFPSYTRPKIGDDKIRIIFDPELTQEVEDLDKPNKNQQ
jgi:Predicted outer membrane protein